MILCDRCHAPLAGNHPRYDVGVYNENEIINQAAWQLHACRDCTALLKTELQKAVFTFRKKLPDVPAGDQFRSQ